MPIQSQKSSEKGKSADYFSKRIASIPADIVSKIAKIDELKGQWIAGATLSPQLLGRLKRSVLITSTGASTRIEGSKLSDEDIEKMMQGLSVKKFSERDVQEVQGYYEMLNNVFDSWKQITFSENTIKHFHKELLKYVEKDKNHLGEYKKQENKVVMLDASGNVLGVVFDTTPPYLTPKKMQELIDWTIAALESKAYQPLLIVGHFLVEFLKIHPFLDGNGRLSRILTNLLLLKVGYAYMPYVSHERFVEENKPEYYIALRRSQKAMGTNKEDITDWLHFFLDMVLKQSQMAVELLSKENIEKILSPKQIMVWRYIESVTETSTGDIVKQTQIARPTVKQVLDVLLKLKRIERVGLGRSARYRKV